MQTSTKMCILRTFLFSYAKNAQGKYADLIHTLCRLVKTFCRLGADYNTTYTSVHLTQCLLPYAKYAHGNFLTKLWFLQDLRGVKGTAPCWLLPGASTGREAGRPRAVWPIRSSAITGEGHNRLTGLLILCKVVIVMAN
jgi:hypothetical protein